MRAVVIHAYGDEDVLAVEEVPVPEPGDGQVRLRVAGAAVNRTDLNLRAGLYPGSVPDGVGATFGMDVSGTVDAVGAGVSDLAVGDAVVAFAGPPATPAAQAEYVVLGASAVAPAPSAVPLVQASVLPLNGLTTVQALEGADLAPGSRVVVTGAAGGLGLFIVQLAKLAGHTVVAWVRPGTDPQPLEDLGADEVVTERAALAEASAAAVLDAGRLAHETVAVIADGGVYVTFRPDEDQPELPRGIRRFDSWVSNDGAQLRRLVEQVDAGDLRLPPATELPLERVADAQRTVAAGGVRARPVLVP